MEKTVEMASLEFLILFKSSVVAFTLQLLFVVINQRERKEISLRAKISICKEVTEGENVRVQKEKHTGKQTEAGISKALYSFTHFEVIVFP